MKKTILITMFTLSLISCEHKKFTMIISSGDGIAYTETRLQCDKFEMINSKEAYIWVDGEKMKVVGSRGVKPSSN
jgi:hypothetical protein